MTNLRYSTGPDLQSLCILPFLEGYTTWKRVESITHLVADTTSSPVCRLSSYPHILFFTGKDATRAFVTGDFTPEGLVDDVGGLSEQDLLSILDWIKFYEKDYKLVGVLQGTYYDAHGKLTEAGQNVSYT